MKKILIVTGLGCMPIVASAQANCPCGTPTTQNPISYSFQVVPGTGQQEGGGTDCCKATPVAGGVAAKFTWRLVGVTWLPISSTAMTPAAAQKECCDEDDAV